MNNDKEFFKLIDLMIKCSNNDAALVDIPGLFFIKEYHKVNCCIQKPDGCLRYFEYEHLIDFTTSPHYREELVPFYDILIDSERLEFLFLSLEERILLEL
jgi:hypothetical protein